MVTLVPAPPRVSLDLHCHTYKSFDGRSRPEDIVERAIGRGLTHLAITDHDTLAGAFEARLIAPSELNIIVGQEVSTRRGDLIGLYLITEVAADLDLEDAVATIREQGGVVGVPHPFDSWRRSVAVRMGTADLIRLAKLVDYVEAYNGRVQDPRHDAAAADFARQHGLPVVAVSDAHHAADVGTAQTSLVGPVDSWVSFLHALRTSQRHHVIGPARDFEPVGAPGGFATRLRRSVVTTRGPR
jgi:predicted metal-dependent phosphoesterase TrpH